MIYWGGLALCGVLFLGYMLGRRSRNREIAEEQRVRGNMSRHAAKIAQDLDQATNAAIERGALLERIREMIEDEQAEVRT